MGDRGFQPLVEGSGLGLAQRKAGGGTRREFQQRCDRRQGKGLRGFNFQGFCTRMIKTAKRMSRERKV